MSKKPKRRPPNRRGASAARGSRRSEEPEVGQVLADLFADPHPLGFLENASTVAEVLDSPSPDEGVDLDGFTGALSEVAGPPETAMLLLLDAFLPGRIPAHRIHRDHAMPIWLARLSEARVTTATLLRDAGGDMEQVLVEVTLAGGTVFTVLVLVDHDAGSSIADAFTLPDSVAEVRARVGEADEDEDALQIEPLAVADVAARLEESLVATELLADPPESDTWPKLRPLLRWAVGLVRPGGAGWPRQQWSEQQLDRLAARIVARNRPLGPDGQDIVRTLLQYAATHALGDPLHWSRRSTLNAIDWIDDHVIADDAWHGQLPEAMRAVVRYAHRERGLPFEQREAILELIDEELEGPGAGLRDLFAGLESWLPDDRLQPEPLLRRLALRVGGEDELDRLRADRPELDVEIPDDVAPRVDDVIALLRPVVTDFFEDPELADVASDFLRRVAAADPAMFRRRSDPRKTAAAAAWIVAKVNDAFGDRRVLDLTSAFGVKGSPSQRATALLAPLGLREWFGRTGSDLGDAALMTTAYRRSIVTRRDEAKAALDVEPAGIPSSIRLAGGETVRVERQPGMAANMLEELRPFLAEQGVDLDDAPDIDSFRAAMDIATEARNQALLSPVGTRRTAAATALRDFSSALAAGDAARADEVLGAIRPESHDPDVAEVAAVIGLGLQLLDEWLGSSPAGVPIGLAGAVLLPREWRKRARPGREIVALVSRGRGFASHGALIARHAGEQVLNGVVIAVAATTSAWATKSGTPVDELLARIVR